jgi:hypothetical protein
LQWQLAARNECDGQRAGAAEESPLNGVAGTGVDGGNYNGKPGCRQNIWNKNNLPMIEFTVFDWESLS